MVTTLIVSLFAAPLLLNTAWLVVLYNRVVNVREEAATTDAAIKFLEIKNVETNDAILRSVGSESLQALVTARGLIEERNPQYFEVGKPWDVFASR